MNILEAMSHLAKYPYGKGSVCRREWNHDNTTSYVYLLGNPEDARGRSVRKPECYRITTYGNGAVDRGNRPCEFDYCDIVADDWEVGSP